MILIIIEIYEKQYTNKINTILKLFAATFFVCMFRNNGLYIVLPTFLFLFFIMKDDKMRRIIIINCIFLCVFFFGWSKILMEQNIPQPVEEALSIPFQQTARLFWDEKKIDEKDQMIIKNLFLGNDLKKIYNPELADPVKFSFKWGNESRVLWKDFYLRYLTQYPTVYIEAFLNQNYGYFYPFKEATDIGVYEIPKDEAFYNSEIYLETGSPFVRLRWFLKQIPCFYINTPILNLIYNCSFYIWTILFLTGLLITEKKYHACIISIPLLLSICVCLLSPVDACIRYMLSIIVTFPIFISYFIMKFNFRQGIGIPLSKKNLQ